MRNRVLSPQSLGFEFDERDMEQGECIADYGNVNLCWLVPKALPIGDKPFVRLGESFFK